jgi:hypothetical protein
MTREERAAAARTIQAVANSHTVGRAGGAPVPLGRVWANVREVAWAATWLQLPSMLRPASVSSAALPVPLRRPTVRGSGV